MTYVFFTLVPIIILCVVYISNMKETYERRHSNLTNHYKVLNEDLEKYIQKLSLKDIEGVEAKYELNSS